MAKHTKEPQCPSCLEKLVGAHLAMRDWFLWVKSMHPEAHVSCAFRDQAKQREEYIAGRSKLDWPMSKHNYIQEGQPCSLALDIFLINAEGKAVFSAEWCRQIYELTLEEKYPIKWGGNFTTLKDYVHFELDEQFSQTQALQRIEDAH